MVSNNVRLSEIADIIMGQSPKGVSCNNSGLGMPLLNGPTEFGTTHPFPTQFTNDPKKVSKVGDILFCVRGSTTGRMNYGDQEYAIGRGIGAIRGKNGYSTSFVKAVIESNLSGLLKIATGTTFPNLGKDALNNFEVKIVNEEDAKFVGSISEQIEFKIANNISMNQTLEKITQRIFKSWFIDFEPVKANKEGVAFDGLSPEIQALFPSEFEESELGIIPKGWEVKPFSTIAKLETKSVKPSSMSDKTWVHFSIPAFDESRFPTLDLGDTIKSNKYKMYPNTVLVSKLNPRFKRVWFPNIVVNDDSSVCSTEFMQFVPNNGYWYSYLISYVISNRFQSEMLKTVSGTTGSRQRAQPKEVAVMQSLIPSNAIVEKYSGIILPIVRRHQDNYCQIQTLKQLRDRLLPKLISGHITVGEAQKELAEAI
ncbi:restriction endonuclease subunit S [Aliivibrio fischeri]|uniref:restriction endonuclease subunit S n=1 Tax=Aliivibrio fischeri TaxID=668 RepID=UPI0018C49C86|nr:restriction endonuclease subunit S [Aliivibrio fischeri]